MSDWLNRVHFGDCLETLRRMPDGIVNTCVTSPPYYGLRDYGHPNQIGLEASPGEFVQRLVEVFREVRRVLREDGTAWVNMGDSYAGSGKTGGTTASSRRDDAPVPRSAPSLEGFKPKDLIGVPWMLAFALRADGWWLRQDIIWHKPNPMPESITDRCTKAHEYIFLLSKGPRYYCDMAAIKEEGSGRVPGNKAPQRLDKSHGDESKRILSAQQLPQLERNKRSVWTVATKPYSGAHFATFPTELIEPCVLAGAPPGGVVLDPFFGSGTTGEVAEKLGRQWIGLELNLDYRPLQDERLRQRGLNLEAA